LTFVKRWRALYSQAGGFKLQSLPLTLFGWGRGWRRDPPTSEIYFHHSLAKPISLVFESKPILTAGVTFHAKASSQDPFSRSLWDSHGCCRCCSPGAGYHRNGIRR
jgi:hypothetical protein